MSELRTRWTSCGALDTSDGFFFFFPHSTHSSPLSACLHTPGRACRLERGAQLPGRGQVWRRAVSVAERPKGCTTGPVHENQSYALMVAALSEDVAPMAACPRLQSTRSLRCTLQPASERRILMLPLEVAERLGTSLVRPRAPTQAG